MTPIRRSLKALVLGFALAGSALCADDGDLDPGFHSADGGVHHFHPGSSGDARTLRVLAAPDEAVVLLVRSEGDFDLWQRVTATGAASPCAIGAGPLAEFVATAATFDRLGRLVVVGTRSDAAEILVARYLYPACTLDTSFDGNGVAGFPLDGATYPGGIAEWRTQPGGPITFYFLYIAFWIQDGAGRDVMLMRLGDDGGLDLDWGGGDGLVRETFPGPAGPPRVIDLRLDSQRRLVVGLDLQDYTDDCDNLGCNDFGVMRFLASGALDDTFDGNGIKRMPIDIVADGRDVLSGLAIGRDDRIALVGEVEGSTGVHLGVAVLLENGSPDSGFDDNGVRLLDVAGAESTYGGAAVYQTDGRLVVAGSARETQFSPYLYDSFAARLLPNGALDGTFGDGGMTLLPVDLYPGANDRATALTLAAGLAIVGGYAVRPGLDEDAYVLRLENRLIWSDGFEAGDALAW